MANNSQSPATESAPHSPDVTGEIVAVLVGAKTFYVHQSLVTRTSKFFQNALKPEWRSDSTKPIDLTEEHPDQFEKYSQWLYTKQTPSKVTADQLAKLYTMGERIFDQPFQNCIINAMIDEFAKVQPSITTIRLIYRETTAESPARRFVADYCAFGLQPGAKRIKALDADVDADFMIDLIDALVKHRRKPGKWVDRPWKITPQLYHHDPSGQK